LSIENLITDHLETWTTAQVPKITAGRGKGTKGQSAYGVKKLRELILELAVRGKLVPQDPADEPASELLKRINNENARSVQEGVIKKRKTLPVVSVDENPFDLPKSWKWVKLGHIAQINPRNSFDDQKATSFIPMPLVWTHHDGRHGQESRLWGEIKKGYTHFADGDIGVAKITPCFENSKAIVFSGLINGIGAGTTELHVARPFGQTLVPRYILLFLKAPMFLNFGKTKMTGTAGQKRLPKSFFEGNPLPFPPLAEQHRIVAKVDELMALCDKLEQEQSDNSETHQLLVKTLLDTLTHAKDHQDFIETWQQIEQNFDILFTTEASIDELKQTILQLAVMGKLVPQNLDDEPASELLKKIAKEKARLVKEGKIKKQKPLLAISENEKLFELPQGWRWARFPEVGEFGRGKSKHRPRNEPSLYSGGIYPMVQTGDVARSNGLVKTYTALYNDKGLAQSRLWPKGTLCITIAANIADTGILDFDACFPDSVVGFIPSSEISKARYFEYFMRTAKAELLKYAPSTAQKNINLGILEQVLIPLPPRHEMKRITDKVNTLMSLCDSIKVGLHKAQTTQVQLADAIVGQIID